MNVAYDLNWLPQYRKSAQQHTLRQAHSTIRLLLKYAVLTAIFALPGNSAGANDAKAIQSVISSQVEAFRRDDSAAAFAFAAPSIQAKFGTAQNFMTMVAIAYPQIYRPKLFKFLKLEHANGQTLQKVLIQGSNGPILTAVYVMQKFDSGWRIAGCYLLKSGEGV